MARPVHAFEAYLLLLLARWRLRLAGGRVLAPGRPRRAPAARPEAVIQESCAALAKAIGRLPREAGCLERSFALRELLRRRGIAAELHIGVRKSAGSLEAHAWVEYDGRVLSDAAVRCAAFQRLTRFPEPRP